MADKSSAALFPLPLSAFEYYMLIDDRPTYPMTSVIDVELRGKLRRDIFDEALDEALDRHPLFRAVIERPWLGRARWVPAVDQRPRVDWGEAGEPCLCPGGLAIDITREVGLRIWVRQGEPTVTITMQLHHTCCDGVGIIEFIGDLLAAYGSRTATGEKKPMLRPLDIEALRRRGEYHYAVPADSTLLREIGIAVWESLEWSLRPPKPLAAPVEPPADNASDIQLPTNLKYVFDQHETKRLRVVAKQHDVSTNELLLRDLFLTIDDWNESHRPGWRGRARVSMPVSLREFEHDRIPAANVVSHAFLTRKRSRLRDPQALLEGIASEVADIMRQKQALWFVQGVRIGRCLPGLAPMMAGNGCYSTAVLTNLGNPTRRFTARFPYESGKAIVGDLVLESIIGSPPMRPKTRGVIGMTVCGGQMMFAARCDWHLFTMDDCRQFVDVYADRIRQTLNGAG